MLLSRKIFKSSYSNITNTLKRSISSKDLQNRVTIETNELEDLMKSEEADRLTIFNATINRRNYVPRDDHIKERIPGSIWFSLKGFSHPEKNLEYMMPPDDQFIKLMKEMDVRKRDLIVIYDKYRMISAPRAFWMIKTFGAPNVYILNGTFSKWQKEGRPIAHGETNDTFKRIHKQPAKPDDFSYKLDPSKVREFEQIQKIVDQNQKNPEKWFPLLDGRVEKYYHRAHIPTSKTCQLLDVMDENFVFKKKEDMIKVFQERGVKDPTKDEIVLTCQRGITACIIDIALRTLGNEKTSVYDGSLEEYAQKTGMEIPKDH